MADNIMNYKRFDDKFINKTHKNLQFYRDLYEGEHDKIFQRPQGLEATGEIITDIATADNRNIMGRQKTPYIIANVTKIIPEIPATFISSAIGKYRSSQKQNTEKNEGGTAAQNAAGDALIDGPETGGSSKVYDKQQEIIDQIIEDSDLNTAKHNENITHFGVDGGILGVVMEDARGIRIDFKPREVYFPHEDDLGADITNVIKRTEEGSNLEKRYLHIYRERIERMEMAEVINNKTVRSKLVTSHIVRKMDENNNVQEDNLTDVEAAAILNMNVEDLTQEYKGRKRMLMKYFPNNPLMHRKLGRSVLEGLAEKQDEINWTLTRNAITFERNGKPRLVVSTATFQELERAASRRAGNMGASTDGDIMDRVEQNPNFIDTLSGNRPVREISADDLEITTHGPNGEKLEVVQIDVDKIGDVKWVNHLIKLMLMETHTSERAVDFYLGEAGGTAQSGVAMFYELLMTIVNCQKMMNGYIEFNQHLVESALVLANETDPSIYVEKPKIETSELIPKPRKELIEENRQAYGEGKPMQSKQTTVQNINPNESNEFIEQEIQSIDEESETPDSMGAAGSLSAIMDNRDRALVNTNQGGN